MKNLFDGLRVVDFTSNAAGHISTAYLADFGAEIVKIEKPGVGDDTRFFSPNLDGVGLPFFWLNRGKKSLVLDMKDPEGRKIARKLIVEADIVVQALSWVMDLNGEPDGPDRIKNLDQLVVLVETWLKTFPDINAPLASIEAAGIPCAKVNTTTDLLKDEQLKVREMITELETPDGIPTRSIKARGNPFKFSRVKAVLKKPPTLGQHQNEVLKSIGYGDTKIAELKK